MGTGLNLTLPFLVESELGPEFHNPGRTSRKVHPNDLRPSSLNPRFLAFFKHEAMSTECNYEISWAKAKAHSSGDRVDRPEEPLTASY
jgi:hypothetical protein